MPDEAEGICFLNIVAAHPETEEPHVLVVALSAEGVMTLRAFLDEWLAENGISKH